MGYSTALSADARVALNQALLIYTSPAGHGYATVHGVNRIKGVPSLDAGIPLSKAELSKIIQLLGKGAGYGTYLPDSILSIGYDSLVWWVPPKERSVFFNETHKEGEKPAIGKTSGKSPQPGLVFAVNGKDWYVYAVKGATRPQPDTKLFHSHYWNTYTDGSICTGNVKTPSPEPENVDKWTAAFFDSNFTHSCFHAPRQVNYKGGVPGLWNDLLKGKYQSFPEKCLLKTDLTLGEFIKQVSRGY